MLVVVVTPVLEYVVSMFLVVEVKCVVNDVAGFVH